MNGVVQSHQAVLGVPLRLAGRPDLVVEFVIDTGFVGELTLPPAAVASLDLPFLRRITANLADDTNIHVSSHLATVVWNGEPRMVQVLATGSRPLLGTLLLAGCELNVWFEDEGAVAVRPL